MIKTKGTTIDKRFRKKIERLNSTIRLSPLRFRIVLIWMDFKRKRRVNKYCKRGHHRIESKSFERSGSNIKTLRCDYIKCLDCENVWFTNKEEQNKYKRLKEGQIDVYRNILKKINQDRKR